MWPIRYAEKGHLRTSIVLSNWDLQADRDVAPPDVGTLIAEDDNSEERAILCESASGARPGVYGLLVKCCAMSLFERSWISRDGARR